MKWILFVLQSFIALIFLGIGGVLVWSDKSGYELSLRYEAEGQITTAQVTEKRHYTFKKRGGKGHEYQIYYRFSDPLGAPRFVTGNQQVRSGMYNNTKEGDVIKVDYIKSDPSINRIWVEQRTYSRGMRTLGAIMIILGLVLQFYITRKALR